MGLWVPVLAQATLSDVPGFESFRAHHPHVIHGVMTPGPRKPENRGQILVSANIRQNWYLTPVLRTPVLGTGEGIARTAGIACCGVGFGHIRNSARIDGYPLMGFLASLFFSELHVIILTCINAACVVLLYMYKCR